MCIVCSQKSHTTFFIGGRKVWQMRNIHGTGQSPSHEFWWKVEWLCSLLNWQPKGEPVRRGVGEESYSALNLEKCGEREVVGDGGELTLNWTHNKGTGHVERMSVHASMDGRVSWHAQGCALTALTTGEETPNRPVPIIMQRSLTEAIRYLPQPTVLPLHKLNNAFDEGL